MLFGEVTSSACKSQGPTCKVSGPGAFGLLRGLHGGITRGDKELPPIPARTKGKRGRIAKPDALFVSAV